MITIAILICSTLFGLVAWALHGFAKYCARRAALAEAASDFLTTARDLWLAILLMVTVSTLMVFFFACIAIFHFVGGLF